MLPQMHAFLKNRRFVLLCTFFTIFLLFCFLLRGGLGSVFLDTDTGRDLNEMSNIKMHRVVWLGPSLSAGFPSSPIYYYLFFPILALSHWDANSLIIANACLAALSLGLLGFLGSRKWGIFSAVSIACIGLAPFWASTSLHPGNGYTYVFWLMLCLTSLWFELPIALSSLFLGLAISYHPAAIFGLPILIYEWWRSKNKVINLGFIACCLLIPWLPIFLFEYITKAFLTRSFFATHAHGVSFVFHSTAANIAQIFAFIGLNMWTGLAVFFIAGLLSKDRLRVWFYLICLSFIFFIFSPSFPPHYVLGITTITVFSLTLSLSHHSLGKYILLIFCLYLVVSIALFGKKPIQIRSISKISRVVDKVISQSIIHKEDKVAVVSILGRDTSVPQADDYRYFLRVKGYQVLDVTAYSQASVLVLFVEDPKFDWKSWSSWETDQISPKKIISINKSEGITIVVFKKM